MPEKIISSSQRDKVVKWIEGQESTSSGIGKGGKGQLEALLNDGGFGGGTGIWTIGRNKEPLVILAHADPLSGVWDQQTYQLLYSRRNARDIGKVLAET